MKKFFVCLAAAGLLGLPFNFAQASFDPATLPSDARWAVYLDLNALRENPAGKELIAHLETMAHQHEQNGIEVDVKKVISTLNSATAYGTTFSKDPKEVDGTLVLRGTDELHKIAEAFLIQSSLAHPDQVTEVKDLGFSAYALKDEVIVAFPPEPIILVSRSKPQLLKALEFSRGKGASGAGGPPSLKNLIPRSKTVLVFAASEVPNTEGLFPEDEPQARILKMATSAALTLGDEGKLTTACIQLAASDDEMADKLLKIVQGLTAMVSLAQSDNQDITAFLKSVKTEREGNIIVITLSFPSAGLVNLIRQVDHAEQSRASDHAAAVPPKPLSTEKVLRTWIARKDPSQTVEGSEPLKDHTIENVALKNGTAIILTGAGEKASIDFIEITSPKAAFPLRFEAENMKLSHYRIEKAPTASGGKLISLRNSRTGTARIEFPGIEGVYTLKVRYLVDDKSVFTVSTKDQEPPDDDEGAKPEAQMSPATPADSASD